MNGDNLTPILDLTRLLSRVPGVLTGVDRVEYAYLTHFCKRNGPAFGLCRTALGYLLLDKAGLSRLITAIETATWPEPDLLSRWNKKLTLGQRRARSLVRGLAIARSGRRGLGGMIRTHCPPGAHYFNVGHSNLSARTLIGVKAGGAKISVLIHDVIPLDYPQFQRPGTVEVFAAKLAQVAQYADRVICLGHAVEATVRARLSVFGPVPETTVASLGCDRPQPAAGILTKHGLQAKGYFICVGTIEPRKNHALLLDIWQQAQGSLPPLVICGGRGWANEAVLARLDQKIEGVQEIGGLSDNDLAGLLQGSAALLFPSFAEGFGLPPIEAALLGVPVIASDIAVLRENLGSYAQFLAPDQQEAWATAIRQIATAKISKKSFNPPLWENHFKIVLSMTC